MTETTEKPQSTTERARDIARRFFGNENAVLVLVLIGLIGGMGVVTKGASLNPANIMNILIQSSIRGVAAVGQTFVVLSAGIDISVGANALLASVMAASLLTSEPRHQLYGIQLPMYGGIAIMLLVATGVGMVNGSLVSRIGVPPLIVTLGMWEILKGAAFQVCWGAAIGWLPEGLRFFGSGRVFGVGVPVFIWIAVAATGYFVLTHTSFGRAIYATGGNPVSAWLSGINIRNIHFTVYVISGFLAGLAGLIATARVLSASMLTATGLELDSIAAVFVGGVSLMGGRGSLIGVVLGTIIIGVINNSMSILGAQPPMQGIVKGAIIITAVAIDCIRRRGR